MPNILLVEDRGWLHDLLARTAVHRRSNVMVAYDVASVWNALRISRPGLALLDLSLRGANGWDIFWYIRMQAPETPVLVVAAYETDLHDPRLSQAAGYIHNRDLRPKDLQTMIERTLAGTPGHPRPILSSPSADRVQRISTFGGRA